MKKAAAKKKVKPTTPLCFNCDEVVGKPVLFCNRLCTDEASFVRSVRRWKQQGRDKDPDIIETMKIQMAHILNGGYPHKERELPAAVRQAVIDRAKGICQKRACGEPGKEIDHIRGSSPDLSNLQLLCRDCHMQKTNAGLKPITPEHPRYAEFMEKIAALTARHAAKKPKRPCDDHETWNDAWRAYKKERELSFAPAAEPDKGTPLLF